MASEATAETVLMHRATLAALYRQGQTILIIGVSGLFLGFAYLSSILAISLGGVAISTLSSVPLALGLALGEIKGCSRPVHTKRPF